MDPQKQTESQQVGSLETIANRESELKDKLASAKQKASESISQARLNASERVKQEREQNISKAREKFEAAQKRIDEYCQNRISEQAEELKLTSSLDPSFKEAIVQKIISKVIGS